MAIEKQDEIKTYVRTKAQVKTAVGAGAGENVVSVELDDGIQIVTEEGTSLMQRRLYRISLIDGRSLLGMANGEEFESIEMATDVTIKTRKRVL